MRLTRSIECLDYSEEFAALDSRQSLIAMIQRASWADWDQQDRLVFARDGKIFAGLLDDSGRLIEKELMDFNLSKPESLAAPEWAKKW